MLHVLNHPTKDSADRSAGLNTAAQRHENHLETARTVGRIIWDIALMVAFAGLLWWCVTAA